MKKNDVKCSFCGTEEKDSELIITNEQEDSFVCLDCINTIHNMTAENSHEDIDEEETSEFQILKPKELKNILDEHIIGQSSTKEKISVSVYNHFKRIIYNKDLDINIQKSNILLIGPSGSGKTLIVQSLSKALNIPFVTADATTLTEAGYVGDDVQTVLLKLLEKTDWDVEKAEKGIIFIDEIDKIAKKVVAGRQSSRDIAGEGVQQALLKMIEGAEVTVEQNSKGTGKTAVIDTSNILFIVAGAFEGLDEIISKRHNLNQKTMGFNKVIEMSKEEKEEFRNKIFHEVTTEDLIEFGVIPELLGRIPSIGVLDKLSLEQMVDILIKPKNSLTKQFKKLFEIDNIKLKFEKKALLEIVKIAEERKIGARGLRSVMEEILQNAMYNIDQHENKTIVVTPKMVIEKTRRDKKHEKN